MTQAPQLPTAQAQTIDSLFLTRTQRAGKPILDCFFYSSKVMAAIALALLALTIISLAFSTAQKIPPMTPFYFLGAFSVSLIFVALFHCGLTGTSKKYRIPLESYLRLKTRSNVPDTP